MENIDKTLETFLATVKAFTGAVPTFKVDFKNNKVIVVDATSGFLKLLVNIDGACTYLGTDGLSFQLLKS